MIKDMHFIIEEDMNKKKGLIKTLFMSNLGACLEYYDYVLYAMLSVYIAEIFFPKNDPKIQAIQSIFLFMVGTFARFCGSIIFGFIGDKFGRRNSMTISIMLMGFSTLTMGCLPTYLDIGIIATILLAMCRFGQGMAFGAEVPSAAVFITESIQKSSKSFNIGILNASISFGSIIASFAIFILTSIFTTQQMKNFGWRIPLILGGGVGILGYLLRKNMPESPEFLDAINQKKNQSYNLLRLNMIGKFVSAICIMLIPASFIITGIYFYMLLNKFFGYTVNHISLYSSISLIFAVACNPIIGKFIDKHGLKVSLYLLILFFALIYTPLVLFMHNNALEIHASQLCLLFFLCAYQILTITSFNLCVSVSIEIFPIQIKNTGFAISYNLASFIASSIPIFLIDKNIIFFIFIPLALGVLGLINLKILKRL
jgi:MFS family permease